LAGLLVAGLLGASPPGRTETERVRFQSGNNYLTLEVLRDDLVHFELSTVPPAPGQPIFTTPQVAKTDYPGPTSFSRSGAGGTILDTGAGRFAVDPASLCLTATDRSIGLELTTLCPLNLAQAWKGLSLTPGSMQNVYGLGEQFITPGGSDGDWTAPGHQVRSPGDNFGNQMTGFNGGATGNAQFPVMYALAAGTGNYALFLDQLYKQRWDFGTNPWKVETLGDEIRGYLVLGPDLPDLRRDYMELTGRPPVPPKKMFGLWLSEYGYDNWQEIDERLGMLRTDGFPVDGFVLDLQWFGGVPASGTSPSRMGSLSWDSARFPAPAQHLADYKADEGLGFITIEESYVDAGLAEHGDLKGRGYLVRNGCPTCDPVSFNGSWWGSGGMLDWTRDGAGDYWHELKRKPLIDAGVLGHWIDLGEPEMYNPGDWVAGILPNKHQHADYHNGYSLKWAQSIARGYGRETRRPFIMARSGASGIQRFGTGMWSGDIGSNLENVAAHMNAQMHMSLSGIDYFGSDIGGFHRGALNGSDLDTVYTQWFANGMALDVPGRPHTENLCNCKQTAPDRIGDKASNLANLRLRYELSPYLYSLAHQAYRDGDPVFPPPVYYYQDDPALRRMGSEKMLGRDLLVATVADRNAPRQIDVYLPAGDWIDYHGNRSLRSTGQLVGAEPLYRDGLFRLPLYARSGAIIPKMYVDGKTLNVVGKRSDGSVRNELIVRVYPAAAASSFTLYEDDGATIAYQTGAVRTTAISQQLSAGATTAVVTVGAAAGTYAGAPAKRDNVLELVVDGSRATGVTLNGTELAERASRSEFDAAASGWLDAGPNLILAKSGSTGVGTAKAFVVSLEPVPEPEIVTADFRCANGTTQWGQSVYVVGNVDILGNWNPAKALKLEPTGPYPTWVRPAVPLPADTAIRWKCIKRPETAASPVVWEADPDNGFTTPASGSAGVAAGDFGAGGSVAVNFACDNGVTVPGQSVYAVGGHPLLGNWDPGKAVKLSPTAYPRWSGTVLNFPPGISVDWKCIKRPETAPAPVVWEPGLNSQFTTPAAGTGITAGEF
jgi:alpha-glucosidase